MKRRWLLCLAPACLVGQKRKSDTDLVMEAVERHSAEAGEAAASGGDERVAAALRVQAKYSFLAGVMWQRDYMSSGIEALRRDAEKAGKR
jgi:hypothetical protein